MRETSCVISVSMSVSAQCYRWGKSGTECMESPVLFLQLQVYVQLYNNILFSKSQTLAYLMENKHRMHDNMLTFPRETMRPSQAK